MGTWALMRVVLDTNILVSALIYPRGAPDAIYRAWRAHRFDLVTSTTQLEELRRVSRYPKLRSILPPHRVGAMINNMRKASVAEQLPTLPDDVTINDPDDAFLLTMVLAFDADYLVTGDHRAGLLEKGRFQRARIVTPVDFCSIALD
ncbi:putative toxin-antitoxin system toxin component, PIN family [Acetobacter pasteurianus]|nr:putative toxin-antitoxin system toxin component, PIN family [Acetobacter pasteurianus]